MLPERAFHSSSMLIDALSSTLGIGEDDLCLGIRDLLKESHTLVAEVVDDWLQLVGVTRYQYLAKVVNLGASIDGLFVWLAVVFSGKHLNIIHATGIWTLCVTERVVMTDVVLIYIIRCFLSTPAMHLSVTKNVSSDLDSEYLQPFRPWYEMNGRYVHIPQVLNKPVCDYRDRVGDVGVTLLGDCKPLPELLASVMNCSTLDLRGQLV